LPHYYLADAVYFVTFCLPGALPRVRVIDLSEKRAEIEGKHKRELSRPAESNAAVESYEYEIERLDTILEKANVGIRWLSDPRLADLVYGAAMFRDGRDYELVALTIMPNHVHIVFGVGEHGMFEHEGQIDNLSYKPVSKIIGSLKRHTAREANDLLGRRGAFWQDESYDHVVRSGKELEAIVRYVINNPVKAGLAKSWREWRWSYSKFEV
jgi:REP element-mobilizing transposase RayT